jgi:hypothetical protein
VDNPRRYPHDIHKRAQNIRARAFFSSRAANVIISAYARRSARRSVLGANHFGDIGEP